MSESKEFKLSRTGEALLSFTGREIASVDGKWHAGRDQNRWHDAAVYQTAGGKYVLEIVYVTMWQGEDDIHTVYKCNNIDEVIEMLQYYDPVAKVIGYPPHPQFSEKQARVMDSLRDRWATQVSELLTALGVEERIE